MAEKKAKGKAAYTPKPSKPRKALVAHADDLGVDADDGAGLEEEIMLPDDIGGGDSFQPVALPAGKYAIQTGAVLWQLRRTEDSTWQALFPLQTLLALEVVHEPRLCRRVNWGPETSDWSVVEIDNVPVLVRPGDLSVYTECDDLEF